MVACHARKAEQERVSSRCNSNSPQAVNPARKNVPNGNLLGLEQVFADFLKIGAHRGYRLVACVTSIFQEMQKLRKECQCLSISIIAG